MQIARIVLVALIAVSASAGVVAQWKWRDRSGVIQYSDLPPPSGTPDKDVLEKPEAFQRRAAAASAPASAVQAAASAPRGLEPELEARRRQAEIDRIEKTGKEAAARQADEERVAMLRAENCRRARSALRTLDDGARIARTNERGEREVLDDKTRADEAGRARAVIASDCAGGR